MKAKHGTVAFISTPQYRQDHSEQFKEFVWEHLYFMSSHFNIVSTGRTYQAITDLVEMVQLENLKEVCSGLEVDNEADVSKWKTTVRNSLIQKSPSVSGMIEITHDLVEGRLDAVIHLTDWADVEHKADSMVLRRQANVHGIPIASDVRTARSLISSWRSIIARDHRARVFRERPTMLLPLTDLTPKQRILALIAHDRKKLDMCCFVVENMQKILRNFDVVLATGTTGSWIQRFIGATGRAGEDVKKIRCCLSGPDGGDVQIAAAVVSGLCKKVVFLQDPYTSHPHETDIRLFEQAVLMGIEVELATNVESAKAILGELEPFDTPASAISHAAGKE
jgi:methylglyoxal synthase